MAKKKTVKKEQVTITEEITNVLTDEVVEMQMEAMEPSKEEECVAPEVIMEVPEAQETKETTLFEKLTPQQLQELQGVANRFSFLKIGRGSGKLTEEMLKELSKEGGFLGMLSPALLSLFK